MMKYIIALFKHLVSPLVVFLMLILGILSVFLSGVIEFSVIKDLFSAYSSNMSNESQSVFIPLVIVLVLEGAKLFLHFFHPVLNRQKHELDAGEANNVLIRTINITKWGLVVFSFLCSIIFVSNSLFQSVPAERDASIASLTQASYDDLHTKIGNINTNLAGQVTDDTQVAKQIWKTASDALDNYTLVLTPRLQYERSLEEKKRLEIRALDAETDYQNAVEASRRQRETTANQRIQELETEHEEYILSLQNDRAVNSAGDNPYLKSFLLFFSDTFLATTYSRQTYFIWVLFIALIISFMLEAIILISQSLISLPEKQLIKALDADATVDTQVVQSIKKVFNILLGALISFAIFVIFGVCFEMSMGKTELLVAFLCYASALSLTMVYLSTKPTISVIPSSSTSVMSGSRILRQIKSVAIESMVSIAMFIVVGFLFGNTFTGMSLSAIGIAIGSLGGNLFRQPISNSVVR